METTECPSCGQETSIEHELTLFLRWLRDQDYLQNNQYKYVVKELELPDPERLELQKQNELMGELFKLREARRETDDEEELQMLEAKIEKIEEEIEYTQ